MNEWYDCDLRYCTFYCNGKCLNKKREECPYAGYFDFNKSLKDAEEMLTSSDESRE